MSKIAFKRLHIHDWPRADRELWLQARKRDNLFDEVGFAADWRPATVTGVEKGYGTYLAWLVEAGSLAPHEPPLERVTQERLKAFLQAYATGRAEMTVASTVRHIAYLVRACHAPYGHAWLTKLAHHMSNSAMPSRPKAPRMATLPELLELGQQLMDEGRSLLKDSYHRGAWLFRDGLLISALVAHPARRRNMAAMQVGKTVFIDPAGIHVSFAGHEMKNRKPAGFTYPAWLTERFSFYLEDVRPRLLERSGRVDDGFVWIGRRGQPMPGNDISLAVGRRTLERLGRRVSMHLFRDCVATGIATLAPEQVGITSSILDHATLASSQKFYNQAQGFQAVDRYQRVLEKMRQKGVQ